MTDENYWNTQPTASSRPPEPPDMRPGAADTSGVDVNVSSPHVSTSPSTTEAFQSGNTATMPHVSAEQQRAYTPSGQQPKPAAAKQSAGAGKTFLFGFLGALVACALAIGGFTAWQGMQKPSNAANNASVTIGATEQSTINAEGENVTLAEAVASKALPSVVYIGVYGTDTSQYSMFGYGSSQGSSELTEIALGSGIILSEDGYILTNYHVIEDSQALKVTVEGVEYDAEIVGTDASSDLAVIKAKDASGLKAADIGDSDKLAVGQWVMSVGSPFGLEQSVATGVVSATSRSRIVESESDTYGFGMTNETTEPTLYPNMIQTDAAINPGNSGGALVDKDGKVIGVNTLIASYSGSYSGVGFAIPINYAINIANQIIEGKTPTHAKLGVNLTNVTSQIAKRYNLSSDYGAYVSDVSAGSGAEAAGVQPGDIIIALDGEKVSTSTDLTLDIRAHNPGDTVTITVNRSGETIDLQATLGSDESSTESTQQQQQQQEERRNSTHQFDGQEYSYEDLLKYFGLL